jgi:hypothetical protein
MHQLQRSYHNQDIASQLAQGSYYNAVIATQQ